MTLEFGPDGMLLEMSSSQHVAAFAIEHWRLTKPVVLRLGVKPRDLCTPNDAAILEAVYEIDAADRVVDFRTVVTEIERLGLAPTFRYVGGVRHYMAAICASIIVVNEQQVRYHVSRVLEEAKWRSREADTCELRRAVHDRDDDRVRELLAQLAKDQTP
jgi:hypothetical protein